MDEKTQSKSNQVKHLVMPLGMTKTPFGYPQMFGDFIGFAQYAINQEETCKDFKKHSGFDLMKPISPLENMIDKACGNDHKEIFACFLDWLVVAMWGEA